MNVFQGQDFFSQGEGQKIFQGQRQGQLSQLQLRAKICIAVTETEQTWSSRDLSLGLETSRDPFLQGLVSVLVLEPQSLGLGLDR